MVTIVDDLTVCRGDVELTIAVEAEGNAYGAAIRIAHPDALPFLGEPELPELIRAMVEINQLLAREREHGRNKHLDDRILDLDDSISDLRAAIQGCSREDLIKAKR